ncbi:MAG: diadenylate cyclase CdaA [Clostridia bacterium]|nr:diadenylate cyclase CdaA [Clostridiales bacterium]MDD7306838.1 diadenylate cyclase CdaA [Eubacteriales bacterium]MDO4351750.1 diadenylate cyclase CdaA [Clostridia bacterium]MDY2933748.1 diadenylate cyclase CdaA [Anaerovoracaceae bacterium]MEE0182360.1 diadenylate cyclase CdaA [Anaerovoracaceae bacterium]
MSNFFQTVFSNIGIADILDIVVVAFIVYKVLEFIRETRAEQLVKGLLLLAAAFFVSDFLNMNTLNWILKGITTMGILALVVVFQPELRRALEYVGRNKFVRGSMLNIGKEKAIKITDEFVTALQNLSSEKTGALIVIERQTALNDRVETGTIIDADISEQLIGNIFYEGAPLHDGAVIVRGDRLYAAGCVLPLTENKNLDKELGTRHRAGIGITEHSDAIAIIVSEETGVISMARDGVITRYLDTKTIEKTLLNLYIPQETDKPSWIKKLLGGKKNV